MPTLYGHDISNIDDNTVFLRSCPFFLLLLDVTVPYSHLYLQRTEHDSIGFEEEKNMTSNDGPKLQRMFVRMSIQHSENDEQAMIIIILLYFYSEK